MPPLTRSKTRILRSQRPFSPSRYHLAIRSEHAHSELVSRKPYSRFHTIPTEIVDEIYDIVSDGNAKLSHDQRATLPYRAYDSLAVFDAYLWEVHAPCTLRTGHPRDFLRVFRRQGRHICKFDDIPVFKIIPYNGRHFVEGRTQHESYYEDNFFEKLTKIVRLKMMLPFIFKQYDLPPNIAEERAPTAYLQFGSQYYDYVLSRSDRRDILAGWRTAFVNLPNYFDPRHFSHEELYDIWHHFLGDQVAAVFAFF